MWIYFGLPELPPKVSVMDDQSAPELGESAQIEARAWGVSEIAGAEVNFRRGGDPSFFALSMTEILLRGSRWTVVSGGGAWVEVHLRSCGEPLVPGGTKRGRYIALLFLLRRLRRLRP